MNTTTTTIEAIETEVKALAAETGLKVTLGYIGNCDSRYDDRLWFVWIGNAREVRTNNLVALNSGRRTRDLADLLPSVTRENLVRVLGRVQWRPAEIKGWDLKVEVTRDESADLLGDLLAPGSDPTLDICHEHGPACDGRELSCC